MSEALMRRYGWTPAQVAAAPADLLRWLAAALP